MTARRRVAPLLAKTASAVVAIILLGFLAASNYSVVAPFLQPIRRPVESFNNEAVDDTSPLRQPKSGHRHGLESCVGVTDPGEWRYNHSSNREWVWRNTSGVCRWRVPPPCEKSASQTPWDALTPLAGVTITLIGESTSREIRDTLERCLLNQEWNPHKPNNRDDDDVVVTSPAGSNITLRFSFARFAREILKARVLLRRDYTTRASIGPSPPAVVPLSTALSNASFFDAYVGDFVIIGTGFWSMGRDVKGNLERIDNHEQFDTRELAVAHSVTEVADVVSFVQGLREPWRSQLKQRLWWKEMSVLERDVHSTLKSDLPRSQNPNSLVLAGNPPTNALWEAAGVPVLHVYKYCEYKNRSTWPADVPALPFTKDGTHLQDPIHHLIFRELLSALVDARVATRGGTNLADT